MLVLVDQIFMPKKASRRRLDWINTGLLWLGYLPGVGGSLDSALWTPGNITLIPDFCQRLVQTVISSYDLVELQKFGFP
jgi:hypothetical protein